MLHRIPKFARNFYFIAGALFVFWMLFLDSNDLISQFQLSRKISSLENEKEYYMQKFDEVQQEHDQLLSNTESLEKFAREKYLMKKDSEDLYVIIDE
ncbi:MAG: septum formation initiator family protein [Cyclobacteriaceae bacterium]|nr:septum formation initiator family protein [Cyclobacteriaceae bacterium]